MEKIVKDFLENQNLKKDEFVDDGLMYAKRLKDAGVPVECKVYEGMPHAFILRTYSETFEALDQICAFLKK